jgi:hypothetical protein
MRKGFLVIFLSVLVIFHLWLASQLSHYSLPEVNLEQEALDLEKEKDNLKLQRIENIVNYTFRFDEENLNLSSYRESQHSAWSIFDVSIDTNIPLRKDLKLSFSMYASQLNLTQESAYVSVTLTDGTNVIFVGYYLGFQLPEWRFLQDFYVSYKVGDMLDIWIKGERNIWDDLVRKNLPLTLSLKVVKAIFGILSYRPTPQFLNNTKMEALFNAGETSLFFETSTFVKITPDLYQFPWNAVFLMIMDLFFLVVFTVKCSRCLPKIRKKKGYLGFSGVGKYVAEKYQLVKAILHQPSGYTYEVWLRKS